MVAADLFALAVRADVPDEVDDDMLDLARKAGVSKNVRGAQ